MKTWHWLIIGLLVAALLISGWISSRCYPIYAPHSQQREKGMSVVDERDAFDRVFNLLCPQEQCGGDDEKLKAALREYQMTGAIPDEFNAGKIPLARTKRFLIWRYGPKVDGWLFEGQYQYKIGIAIDRQGNIYGQALCV